MEFDSRGNGVLGQVLVEPSPVDYHRYRLLRPKLERLPLRRVEDSALDSPLGKHRLWFYSKHGEPVKAHHPRTMTGNSDLRMLLEKDDFRAVSRCLQCGVASSHSCSNYDDPFLVWGIFQGAVSNLRTRFSA